MVKKLTKHGNSLALVIDRPILELLQIDQGTPLELSTDGKRLIVAVASSTRRKKFEAAQENHGQREALLRSQLQRFLQVLRQRSKRCQNLLFLGLEDKSITRTQAEWFDCRLYSMVLDLDDESL